MNKTNLVSSTAAGITLMTVFSYIVSALADDNFKEPELLAVLMKRLGGNWNKPLYLLAGWQLHYLVGLLFVSVYTYLWERNYLKRDLKNGLFLGFLSGIIGIGFWNATFSLHPNPPKIQLKKYFAQLLVAHLLFGAGAACNPLRRSAHR